MSATPASPHALRLPHFLSLWIVGLFVAVFMAFTGAAHAAAPAKGTSISNQASASYTDISSVSRTVTSNVVSTIVAQVASVTIVSHSAQTATPGSIVYYPHVVTNTGNGSDTFNLTSSNSGGFSMSSVQFFADDGSGRPTGAAITSTGVLAAGATFKLIAVGTVPNTATAGQTNAMVVTATSQFLNTATDSKTDTTTITTNAVVTLNKAISVSSGPSPLLEADRVPYTYTLTYTNTGNSTATAVAISDVIPAGMTYVANSARWSVTVATPIDTGVAVGTLPNQVTASYTAGTTTFLATLNSVAPGQSGTISFQVKLNLNVAPGVINNMANLSYNNGATTTTGVSNTVPFTVTQIAGVTMPSPAALPGPANPGSTVSFTNVVTNTGNGTDTFNITLAASNTFPAGTMFQLFKTGGLTPLVDTNGDGIIDTGPLAAGATYNVVLKATLPPNASGAGPFAISKTATSVFDPTKSAIATDTLTAITGNSVDLTNNTTGGIGNGNLTLADTNAINPGNSTTFTLVVKNTGPSPDSYDLAASTVANFSSLSLPAGWTVTFKADGGSATACSTTGATITNTGSIPVSSSVKVCAVVTVPPNYVAGLNDVYFRTLSPTSSASDILHDAVDVNSVRSITVTPNGAGQTYPGGSYVYSHTLTNTGNMLEGSGTLSSVLTLSTSNSQAGWTSSTLYYDTNNNGVLDAADPLITSTLSAVRPAGLAAGASITIFHKVIAPSGAVPGAVNATTITVTTTNGATGHTTTAPLSAAAIDSTTVIAGNLTLNKTQVLDAACDGTADGLYATNSFTVKPGECVLYQITVTNVGSSDATSVVVSDMTPTYTTLKVAATTSLGTVTGPAVGATGAITATVGTLPPGQSSVLSFGVQINQ